MAFVEERAPAESEPRTFTGKQASLQRQGGGCGTLLVSHEFDATAAISRYENRKHMNSRISEYKEVSSLQVGFSLKRQILCEIANISPRLSALLQSVTPTRGLTQAAVLEMMTSD